MDDKIELLKNVCKEHGVKLTHQRLEIYHEIIAAKDHPSAEDIYNRVKNRIPTISLDTVYRTLTSFHSWGIISKIYLFNDRIHFDPHTKPHHHMLCTKCNELCDFYWPEFDRIDLPEEVKEWGKTENKIIEIRGICKRCLPDK